VSGETSTSISAMFNFSKSRYDEFKSKVMTSTLLEEEEEEEGELEGSTTCFTAEIKFGSFSDPEDVPG
jgi:hypothetical protein